MNTLELFETIVDSFLVKFTTRDECWVYRHLGVLSISIGISSGSLHHITKKRKGHTISWKGDDIILGDCLGAVFIYFLEKRHTIIGDYYADLLILLRKWFWEKRKEVLFTRVPHHDNAATHISDTEKRQQFVTLLFHQTSDFQVLITTLKPFTSS